MKLSLYQKLVDFQTSHIQDNYCGQCKYCNYSASRVRYICKCPDTVTYTRDLIHGIELYFPTCVSLNEKYDCKYFVLKHRFVWLIKYGIASASLVIINLILKAIKRG
jgi:hypothetical protein